MKDIEILKEDIVPYVYFVCSMTHVAMHGALGAKSDFIGGVFDRWINIIPESLIFNKLILPKAKNKAGTTTDISVYSDFYKYNPKNVGIAPDVLGLQIDEKIVPFVKYDDTQNKGQFWVAQAGCPQIEVKSFKGKQKMVSLRDQNYKDRFLIMVEMDLEPDYLLPFFNQILFTEKNIKKLEMPEDFIISNEKGQISQTSRTTFEKAILGTLKLLTIMNASDFMSVALKLEKGQIPRYFVDVKKRKILVKQENMNPNMPLSHYGDLQPSKLFRFNDKWYELFSTDKERTVDIYIENAKNIQVINKIKNAITVIANENAKINGEELLKGNQYNINFSTFGAVSSEEYFVNKCVLEYLPQRKDELIDALAKVIKDN